jgi:hypothetical protein
VRCGSCLTIFNANENLIETEIRTSTKAASKTTSENKKQAPASPHGKADTAPKPNNNDELISDDMDISETGEHSSLGFDENVFVASNASNKDLNLFERRMKAAEKDEQNRVQADESWAQQLLDDESDKDEIIDDDLDSATTDKEQYQPQYPTDTDPVFQIIEEDTAQAPLDEDINTELIRENVFADELDEDEHYEEFEESEFESEGTHDSFLQAFEPEPIEFTGPKRAGFWYSNTFWGAMSAVLMLVALFQLSAFNIESWARSTKLRPYYASACKLFGCKLPNLVATDKIRIENMVVLAHPSKDGTLLVDATIINEASFEQMFPVLLLSFSDVQDTMLDQFKFSPRDYVGGELAGKRLMPALHPIHINLEVPDPGSEAVNYRFSIVKK